MGTGQAVITGWDQLQSSQLVARAYLKLGTWQWGLCEEVDDQVCIRGTGGASSNGQIERHKGPDTLCVWIRVRIWV